MIKRAFLFLIILFFFSFSFIQSVAATTAIKHFNDSMKTTGNEVGYSTTGESISLPKRIGGIINVAYVGALGIAFLALMIYSGYIWMTARGNEQEVEKAKTTIRNAIVGLIIAVAAYGITIFLSQLVTQAKVT